MVTLWRASYSAQRRAGLDPGPAGNGPFPGPAAYRQPPSLTQGIPKAPGREEGQASPYLVLGDLGEPEKPPSDAPSSLLRNPVS